jgi:hypothetical protein
MWATGTEVTKEAATMLLTDEVLRAILRARRRQAAAVPA